MAVSCNANDLLESGKCFCYPTREAQVAVELYLMAVIAGGSLDPNELLRQATAAGFMAVTDKRSQDALLLYLACAAATAAGA